MKFDKPAVEDLLDRKKFAENIAKSIFSASKREKNGFVLGITGTWGSGKTTLLNFIRDHLKSQYRGLSYQPVFVEFNPWSFSEEENIRKPFLSDLLSSIDAQNARRQKMAKRVFKWIGLAKIVGCLHVPLGDIGKDLSALLKKYIERDSSHSLKMAIDRRLEKEQRKIFVFIDDIDRLALKQVFELFQVLQLIANFANTYYVVAYDREVVEKCIESQFKDFGKGYLDKIVQADFGIPQIAADRIEQIFFNELLKFVELFSINYNHTLLKKIWTSKGLRHYFLTLRDVYRFYNSITLSFPHVAGDVNFIDFLIIEVIRLFDYRTYQDIYQMILVKFNPYCSVGDTNIQLELPMLRGRLLLEHLFPSGKTGVNTANEKRICDPSYYDRYFTLSPKERDVSEMDLLRLLESSNRQFELSNIDKFNRLDKLIRRLGDPDILSSHSNWDFSLIRDLYTFWENNEKDLEESIGEYIKALVNLLSARKGEQGVYFRRFFELIRQSNTAKASHSMMVIFHFVLMVEQHHRGLFNGYQEFQDYCRSKHDEFKQFYVDFLFRWKG